MYAQDIKGSIAHAKMLGKQGIIDVKDSEKIVNGLLEVLSDIENGKVEFLIDAEDIQTFEIFDVNGENYGKIVSDQHRLPYILREKGYARGVYVAKSAKKVIKVIAEKIK